MWPFQRKNAPATTQWACATCGEPEAFDSWGTPYRWRDHRDEARCMDCVIEARLGVDSLARRREELAALAGGAYAGTSNLYRGAPVDSACAAKVGRQIALALLPEPAGHKDKPNTGGNT